MSSFPSEVQFPSSFLISVLYYETQLSLLLSALYTRSITSSLLSLFLQTRYTRQERVGEYVYSPHTSIMVVHTTHLSFGKAVPRFLFLCLPTEDKTIEVGTSELLYPVELKGFLTDVFNN